MLQGLQASNSTKVLCVLTKRMLAFDVATLECVLCTKGCLWPASHAPLPGALTIECCWQELVEHHSDRLDQLFVPAFPVWAQ
jgi:hypothetical protein